MLCLATAAAGLAVSQSGCLLPTPTVLEEDAGTGGRPQILRKDTLPQLPDMDQHEGDNALRFTICLNDPDSVELTIRMFLDSNYSTRLPLTVETFRFNEESVGQDQCFFTLLNGLCGELITDLEKQHPLELWVSDAGFIPDPANIDAGGTSNPYIDLRQPGPGGTRDGVTWRVRCLPALPQTDAGVSR